MTTRPSWRGAYALPAAAAAAILVAACGSVPAPGIPSATPDSSPRTSTTPATGNTGSTAAPQVALTVSFAGPGPGPTGSWTLRCDPPGGTDRDPAAACAALIAKPDLLFPAPVRQECPMIRLDAPAAVIDGTYFGKAVHEQVVAGGCDLGRWHALRKIFA